MNKKYSIILLGVSVIIIIVIIFITTKALVANSPNNRGQPYIGLCPPNQEICPPEKMSFQIEECETDGVAEPCFWYYQYNPELCNADNKCTKLVIFFSGGNMGCDDVFV